MKKPEEFELKEWLYENEIKGLIVHEIRTGEDSSYSEWEMIPVGGGTRQQVAEYYVRPLVVIGPTWNSVLTLRPEIQEEVKKYLEFLEKEKEDYAEYERLKRKFG